MKLKNNEINKSVKNKKLTKTILIWNHWNHISTCSIYSSPIFNGSLLTRIHSGSK
jgi:hypothetical protein